MSDRDQYKSLKKKKSRLMDKRRKIFMNLEDAKFAEEHNDSHLGANAFIEESLVDTTISGPLNYNGKQQKSKKSNKTMSLKKRSKKLDDGMINLSSIRSKGKELSQAFTDGIAPRSGKELSKMNEVNMQNNEMSVELTMIGPPPVETFSYASQRKHEMFEAAGEEFEFSLMEDVKESKVRKHLFKFLASLIQGSINLFPKNVDLKIMISLIQRSVLKNEFKAIFELMNCELGCKPTFTERFTIFVRKVDIEHQLIQNSDKNSSVVGNLDIKLIYR